MTSLLNKYKLEYVLTGRKYPHPHKSLVGRPMGSWQMLKLRQGFYDSPTTLVDLIKLKEK